MDRLYSNKQMQACANMLYYQVKALDGSRIVSTNDGWEFVQSDIFNEAFLLTEYGDIAFEDKSSSSWGYHGKVSDEEAFFERY